MGDRLQTGKTSRYVTSHPGQLSLAIPPWVGAMSTSESWGVNRHTARCTSSVSVVWQCKLVSGWGLRTEISAAVWASWLGKDFTLSTAILTRQCKSSTVSYRIISKWRLDLRRRLLDFSGRSLGLCTLSAEPKCRPRRYSVTCWRRRRRLHEVSK